MTLTYEPCNEEEGRLKFKSFMWIFYTRSVPMSSKAPAAAQAELIDRLDTAVQARTDEIRSENVKSVLKHCVERGDRIVEEQYLQPSEDHYARHLLHRDPNGRYSVLVMVWGPGQGTPLHDHNGKWCVECVYRGRNRVTSYEKTGEDDERDDVVYFEKRSEVVSGFGDAGALIPPYEYHVLQNDFDETMVTLHVYDQELRECNAYYPVEGEDGAYRREHKELYYTSEIPD